VQGKDVVELLQTAFTEIGLNLQIVALCNDTVGTLVNAYGSDSTATMGVILGTGSNAAYWEKKENIPKWINSTNTSDYTAINMEWGNFDAGTPRILPTTSFDREVDAASPNRGRQLYEKMISGLYLSQICISIFRYFSHHQILPPLPANLPFTGWDVTKMLKDEAKGYPVIAKFVRETWSVEVNAEQCAVLRDVCYWVTRRSARLAAMGIATVVMKLKPTSPISVAIDGSLYGITPFYEQNMNEALAELLGPDVARLVKCGLTSDGSGVGAGIIAALA